MRPGKPYNNTGVGSHSFLQGNLPNPGIEPKSPTLQMDSLLAELEGKPKKAGVGSLIRSPADLPDVGIEPWYPTLQMDSLPAEPQGKPKNTGVGSLSLRQGIFPTQESNPRLPHCRRILFKYSCLKRELK